MGKNLIVTKKVNFMKKYLIVTGGAGFVGKI